MNPHSNLASFYRYFYYTGDLPNNLCNYFWGLVLVFVSLPFVWIAIAINWYQNKITFDDTTDKYCDYSQGSTPIITEIPRNTYKTSYGQIDTWIGLIFTIILMIVGVITGLFIDIKFHKTFTEFMSGNVIHFILVTYLLGLIATITSVIIILFGFGVNLFFSKIFDTIFPPKPKKVLTFEEVRELAQKSYDERSAKHLYKMNNPNFLTLTWRWVKAKKEKNCPIITWDYNSNK